MKSKVRRNSLRILYVTKYTKLQTFLYSQSKICFSDNCVGDNLLNRYFIMAILDEFWDKVKPLAKKKTFRTDNHAFWFFYRVTVWVHILFALLLGGKSFFGDPIDCAIRKTEVKSDLIDNYCWITGTWTVRDKEPHEFPPNSVRRKV